MRIIGGRFSTTFVSIIFTLVMAPLLLLSQGSNINAAPNQTDQVASLQAQIATLQTQLVQSEHDRLAFEGLVALFVYEGSGPSPEKYSKNWDGIEYALEHPETIEVVTDGVHTAVRLPHYSSRGDISFWRDPRFARYSMDVTFRYSLPLGVKDWPDWSSSGHPNPGPLTLSR